MEYRCGCCHDQATASFKVAWCNEHDMYECHPCWEHNHDDATEDTWGCDDDEDEADGDPGGPERPAV